ncbi:MAG TPA: hypothetical protein VMV54_00280 [Acidocella sp.]|nr:hypothetical protein [Acidocella sp.]
MKSTPEICQGFSYPGFGIPSMRWAVAGRVVSGQGGDKKVSGK